MIGGTVLSAATIARSSALDAARQQSASELMMTAMLNQETGARGYFQTFDPVFLRPYRAGASDFAQALSESRSYAGEDSALQRALSDEAQRSNRWHANTQAHINQLQTVDLPPTEGQALADKATMQPSRNRTAGRDRNLVELGWRLFRRTCRSTSGRIQQASAADSQLTTAPRPRRRV